MKENLLMVKKKVKEDGKSNRLEKMVKKQSYIMKENIKTN
jgi:hypothetical protein